MIDAEILTQAPTIKLYSQKAIGVATFFGGPVAAGILIRKNFIALGKKEHAFYALIIGIASTILLFIGIFSIPQNILDKTPNTLIPIIYTAVIYYINEIYQGKELKEHKEKNGIFYSNWKAAGVGAIFMSVLLGVLGIYFYSTTGYILPIPKFDTKLYDSKIAEINKNEAKALELFTLLEKNNINEAIEFIDDQGIKAWEDNIQILNELDKSEGLYKVLIKQDKILRIYCNLRIESFKLIRKALVENTNLYDKQIEDINRKIDMELSNLK
jgi:hypothetical protein